jgi:MOSC domain-containing protein YiiM
MHVMSVNVGRERVIVGAKKTGTTGIYKEPAHGPVRIERLGLVGDTIVDQRNHGGPDQAVYVYGADDYAWWGTELGRELAPGTFGENLTIAGLESANFSVGDRLSVGTALLEVTAPRIPCSTLAARMEDPTFAARFRQAERPGLYCRVIREGDVRAGDPVSVTRYDGATLTIGEMFRCAYERDLDEAAIRRQLAAPIAVRDRVDMEARLRRVRGE